MTRMTTGPLPHAVADEAKVRNLAAQALAIWPQEELLIEEYKLPDGLRILDVGCGTGEIPFRLADKFPGATILGVDPYPSHIELARLRNAQYGERVRFEQCDPFALPVADREFDFTVCRHLLQAVPYPERVVDELIRATKPGGRLHVLAEDYGMFHFHPTQLDTDVLWRELVSVFGPATHTDLRIGRRAYTLLRERGVQDVRVDYVQVDPVRVSRDVCAQIIEAWRDNYAETITERSRFTLAEVRAFFDDMIGCIRHPRGYGVWQVPIVTGTVSKSR
jgi:SAM-dependent methyltransferase